MNMEKSEKLLIHLDALNMSKQAKIEEQQATIEQLKIERNLLQAANRALVALESEEIVRLKAEIGDLESRILSQNNQAWRYEDQIAALQAELHTVIYKHAEAENTIIKLTAALKKENA